MPMIGLIASASVTGLSGISAGAPLALINASSTTQLGNNLANVPGMYAIAWSYIVTAGGSAGGSAQVPCFTWRDPNLNVGVTSTGGGTYAALNGGATGTLWGASGSAGAGISGTVSSHANGFHVFQAGSGASGASAYIQVSSVGTGGAFTRFDYKVFLVDLWGV